MCHVTDSPFPWKNNAYFSTATRRRHPAATLPPPTPTARRLADRHDLRRRHRTAWRHDLPGQPHPPHPTLRPHRAPGAYLGRAPRCGRLAGGRARRPPELLPPDEERPRAFRGSDATHLCRESAKLERTLDINCSAAKLAPSP